MADVLARLRPVTSSQNALVKELRHAFRASECTAEGYCAIESVRTIEEAIRSGLRLRAVFFSQSGKIRAQKLLPQISTHVEAVLLPDAIFAGAVATETPQGVAALVRMPQPELADVVKAPEPLIVVAAGVQDPGNLGTIIRSAEAFGAAGVLLTEGTVSAFNSKVVRASAGSLFRLPVVKAELAVLVAALREHGIKLLGMLAHKGTPLPEANLQGGVAVFVGNEGAGLPKALAHQVEQFIMIPQSAAVDSLNAGIAASIVLYEASRQRSSNAETQRRRGE